jgi:hypothetical protein
MTGFKQLTGEFVIVSTASKSGYGFKQLDLYTYDGGLWAKSGGEFIRIMENGHTRRANICWRSASRDIKRFDVQGRAMA